MYFMTSILLSEKSTSIHFHNISLKAHCLVWGSKPPFCDLSGCPGEVLDAYFNGGQALDSPELPAKCFRLGAYLAGRPSSLKWIALKGFGVLRTGAH